MCFFFFVIRQLYHANHAGGDRKRKKTNHVFCQDNVYFGGYCVKKFAVHKKPAQTVILHTDRHRRRHARAPLAMQLANVQKLLYIYLYTFFFVSTTVYTWLCLFRTQLNSKFTVFFFKFKNQFNYFLTVRVAKLNTYVQYFFVMKSFWITYIYIHSYIFYLITNSNSWFPEIRLKKKFTLKICIF